MRSRISIILPWKKVYVHLAIKLIYWQNTDKKCQPWYSIFGVRSLGLNNSSQAPGHWFVQSLNVMGVTCFQTHQAIFFSPAFEVACLQRCARLTSLQRFSIGLRSWELPGQPSKDLTLCSYSHFRVDTAWWARTLSSMNCSGFNFPHLKKHPLSSFACHF